MSCTIASGEIYTAEMHFRRRHIHTHPYRSTFDERTLYVKDLKTHVARGPGLQITYERTACALSLTRGADDLAQSFQRDLQKTALLSRVMPI